MASNVVSDNFETGSGGVPQLGGADRQTQWCKAWVNFNGTGTVAIRDSFNVSSITDNSTGQYTVNFTTAMADTNYCLSGMSGITTGTTTWINQPFDTTAPATTSVRVGTCYGNGSSIDSNLVSVAIFS